MTDPLTLLWEENQPTYTVAGVRAATHEINRHSAFFQTPEAIAMRDRVARPTSVTLAPGAPSLVKGAPNMTVVGCLYQLRTELSSHLPQAERIDGFNKGGGADGPFTKLQSLSGWGMNPEGLPPVDNSNRTLPGPQSDADAALMDEVFSAMFDFPWEPSSNFRIRLYSGSSFPVCTQDEVERRRMMEVAIHHLPAIREAFASDRLGELFDRTNIMLHSKVARRRQPEDPAKERTAPTLEDIVSGTTEPTLGDKRIPGCEGLDIGAERIRVAYGPQSGPNHAMGGLMQTFGDAYLREYEKTWVTRSAEELAQSMEGFYWIGVDIKQYDQHVMLDCLRRWSKHYGAATRPWLADLALMFNRAPIYCPPHIHGDATSAAWFGHPTKATTFLNRPGLLSGFFGNPHVGKGVGVWALLQMLDAHIMPLAGRAREVLAWRHPDVRLKNSADDAMIGLRRREDYLKLLALLKGEKSPSPYFVFTLEEPVSYLGHDVRWLRETVYSAHPKVTSYVGNFMWSERGIGSKFREYWGLGFKLREKLFEAAHGFETAQRIWRRVFHAHLGYDLWEAALAQAEIDEAALRSKGIVGALSEAEMQIIIKPDLIAYRDDLAQQVRPELLALVARSVTPADQRRLYGDIMEGKHG